MNENIKLSKEQYSFLETEYSLLRSEIVKRMEFKGDAIKFNLLIFSIFLTIIGLPKTQPVILLIFPVVSLFIAFRYRESDMKIAQLGKHLLNIERKFSVDGWERERSRGNYLSNYGILGPLDSLHSRGVFMITQILAVGIWFVVRTKTSISVAELIFLTLDLAAATFTLLALRHHRTDNIANNHLLHPKL
jgi:hypothetical protein